MTNVYKNPFNGVTNKMPEKCVIESSDECFDPFSKSWVKVPMHFVGKFITSIDYKVRSKKVLSKT